MTTHKSNWYNAEGDNSPIISCRVRLARNLKKYPFLLKLDKAHAKQMIDEVVETTLKQKNFAFNYTDLSQTTKIERKSLVEYHKISVELALSKGERGVLSSGDDTLHIMLNEEDHIRIQSIAPGKNIEKAYNKANLIDNLIEQNIEYAFDEKFGYLTSCPTNTGTGMRASYMLHLPMLENEGRLPRIINSLSSFGMTIRGLYGEGTEPAGNIYQISNQVTLGKSEEEMLSSLQSITSQIVQSELEILDNKLNKHRIAFEDKVYRAYGTLKYARAVDVKEARSLLSTLRVGHIAGLLKDVLENTSIFSLMMNIEEANLRLNMGVKLADEDLDVARATYISQNL